MPYRPMPAYDTGVRELGDGLYAYLQWDGGWGISNAGFFDGGDGLLVIDALMVPSMTRRFVEAMRGVSNAPFRHLVNTHQHLDHTAGNQFIEGAEIVAHEMCRQEMVDLVASRPAGERGPKQPWMPDDWWEELAQVVPTYPQTTFADHLTLRYGDTEARLMHFGPAHTLGDAMVYFPESRILFSGDLAFFYATPLCRGDLENWINVVDLMLELEVDTIIPGHGPVGTRLELSDQREYMDLIVSRTREMFDAGVGLEDAQAQIDVGEFAQWPESERNPMNVATLYAKWLSGGGSGV